MGRYCAEMEKLVGGDVKERRQGKDGVSTRWRKRLKVRRKVRVFCTESQSLQHGGESANLGE